MRVADPVLTCAAEHRLRRDMPVEQSASTKGTPADREKVTHYEALTRTLVGIAPFMELDDSPEAKQLARRGVEALHNAFDPESPDAVDFKPGGQIIVDSAFLCAAFLHAPKTLWEPLDGKTRSRIISSLQSLRTHLPGYNNWLLFAATSEAFLSKVGEAFDPMRVDYAMRQHELWYVGGGWYKDGPSFHHDYYNSFVIQPLLLQVAETLSEKFALARTSMPTLLGRARRFAEVLERLIAPDGSYPVTGRSITYRCGAFQLLAYLALHKQLPESLPPGQVRTALTATIRRTLSAPGTFDANGWLTIGLSGHQPSLGEGYISTGSLYLCTTAFLPLGLPASDPFWTQPDMPFTGQKAWGGEDLHADHD
jgi:hypothetical protein